VDTISKEATSMKKNADAMSSKIEQAQNNLNQHIKDRRLHPIK